MTTARGTFEVTLTPLETEDGLGRFRIEKSWHGDLEGSGQGLMLSAGDPVGGRAGYVAMEVVEGSLGGRRGSFALQQSGVMDAGGQQLSYRAVPGSGSGELAGLDGVLELVVEEDGAHRYALAWSVEEQPAGE